MSTHRRFTATPMRRRLRLLGGALACCLAACSSSTAPRLVVDPGLGLDAAHARWIALRPSSYVFEFATQGAWSPSEGFYRATVADGSLVRIEHTVTAAPLPVEGGFTIDALWDRIIAAKVRGDLGEVRFSREGIPIQAMIGSFANDGGVLYQVRAFVAHR